MGQKKGGADEGDDAQDEDVGAAGADVAGGNNAKAAFVRAKSKVLKKLSTQHLISHTLPVIISLKHVLEASKSPLQVRVYCNCKWTPLITLACSS